MFVADCEENEKYQIYFQEVVVRKRRDKGSFSFEETTKKGCDNNKKPKELIAECKTIKELREFMDKIKKENPKNYPQEEFYGSYKAIRYKEWAVWKIKRIHEATEEDTLEIPDELKELMKPPKPPKLKKIKKRVRTDDENKSPEQSIRENFEDIRDSLDRLYNMMIPGAYVEDCLNQFGYASARLQEFIIQHPRVAYVDYQEWVDYYNNFEEEK